MTGIGQTSVTSTEQVLTVVEINDITLEILFHVLPDTCLRHNIMIGREVLAQGVAVHMTSNELHFGRVVSVESCEISTVNDVDFNSIDTDIIPFANRDELLAILDSFKGSFTTGIPELRADAEPMQIRLKDPHKTVNRRPYRLSPEERRIVRGKIDELLKANIIRPSSSPFSSPVLLVKKKDGTDRLCVDYIIHR